jgi:acyl dehydratase
MSFHPEQIGVWGSTVEFPVTVDGMVAYAEATNDPIAAHREGRLAPPVFAIVPAFGALADRTLSAVPDELMMRVLHGEHDFRFHRPIVAGDQLTCRAKVTGIHGKSSGVVVGAYLETRDDKGDLVNEQYFTGFFRGGEFGEAGEPVPQHAFDQSLREREPDWTAVQKYDEDQTFRYAKASGDPMPIHTDDAFAKSVGLPGIIIHGMCTMAFTSHAVICRASPAHPENLKRLAVRFSAPAQPKHTIITSAWNTKPGTYAFETVTDEGATIIKDGLAEFAA